MRILSKIGLLFLLASLSLESMARAGLMLSVSLVNPSQSGDEFRFDIEASLTGGTPDDYVNSLTLGLDMSSSALLSSSPYPFQIDFAAGWDGAVDSVLHLLQFDVLAFPPFPPDVPNYLFNGMPQIIGTLLVDGTALSDGQYTVSLNSSISLALGSDENFDVFVVDTSEITPGSATFDVQRQPPVIPEPASCWIFGLIAGVGCFWPKIRQTRLIAGRIGDATRTSRSAFRP